MPIRAFRPEDAGALVAIARSCARGETDFVLVPLWESEHDLFAEYERHGVDPEEHLLVAEAGDGLVIGCAGFVRRPGAAAAGLVCPVVSRDARGRGTGGELLRAALAAGSERLGIKLVSAAIGVRNRAGYSLLAAVGFRAARQHFLMRLDGPPQAVRLPIEGLVLDVGHPEDADAIGALYAASGFEPRTPEAMRAALADGRHAHAVARHGGRIVAFVELETYWPERPWVAYVGVDAMLQNRGVGSALVAWVLARHLGDGAPGETGGRGRCALLLLSPGNRPALQAYEKVGFCRHRLVDVLEKGL
jgi:ribosomal protein S18 acetylase RimI-like enzyme